MSQTINISEYPPQTAVAAAMGVVLQGFKIGEEITLRIYEDDSTLDSIMPNDAVDQIIGTITGEVVPFKTLNGFSLQSLKVKKSESAKPGGPKLAFVFEQADGAKAESVTLELPQSANDAFEGDSWEIFISTIVGEGENADRVVSPTTRLARVRRALTVGTNGAKGEATYHYYQGNSALFFHDGAQNAQGGVGYFAYLKRALSVATDFIFISDWSFHPLFRLERRTSAYELTDTIGYLLVKKAVDNPKMLIAIHAWDHTDMAAPDKQNEEGDIYLDQIAMKYYPKLFKRPSNLLWIKSSRTGIGYSHHQKFIVCDSPLMDENHEIVPDVLRLMTFLGGLDLTKGRFDWGDHPILPDEPGAEAFYQHSPSVYAKEHDDWYNAELYDVDQPAAAAGSKPDLPRQPWHDVAVALIGPSCHDIVREFVGRWLLDPSNYERYGDTFSNKDVTAKFKSLFERLIDPDKPYHPRNNPLVYRQQWHPAAGPWSVQVCRSMVRQHWEQPNPISVGLGDHRRNEFRWTLKNDYENSIALSYLQAIRQAENFIYIETQYFISSGNLWLRPAVANQIAQALADRAVERARAHAPFHIYLVLPMFPEGDPGSAANATQRQFQWKTIRAMADRIRSLTVSPWQERLSVLFPARWNELGHPPAANRTRRENIRDSKRYPIYVHSKYMLVDDRYIFIGSANLNERSLSGRRDSEIGVAMWASNDASLKQCIAEARSHRESLWREHLGPGFPEADYADPGSAACINAVRSAAAENYLAFREGRFDPDRHGHLCLWPLESDPAKLSMVNGTSKATETDDCIPDRPFGLAADKVDIWRWDAPGPHLDHGLDMTAQGMDIAE